MRTLHSLNRASLKDAVDWLELVVKRGQVGFAQYDTGSEMGTVVLDRTEANFGSGKPKLKYTSTTYVNPDKFNALANRVLELEKTEVVFEGVIKRR